MNTKMMSASVIRKDAKKNRYTIRATSDTVDRQGERVIPNGVTNLDAFLKSGSILYGHDWGSFPIGKPHSGKATDHELLLEISFAPTPLGQEAKQLFDGGYLNSFSIGFLPALKGMDVIDGVVTYKAWQLLEVSAVPVPANPDAVMLRAPVLAKALAGPEDPDEDEELDDQEEDELEDEIKLEEEQLEALNLEIDNLSRGVR